MILMRSRAICPYCDCHIYCGLCGCSEWDEIGDSLVLVAGPPTWLARDYEKYPTSRSTEAILTRMFARVGVVPSNKTSNFLKGL